MDYFNQETKRLRFRALCKADTNDWLEFFENNDRLGFLGIDLSECNIVLARKWVIKQLERYENNGLGHLAVIEKSTGKFIGMGGILKRDLDGKEEYEISYSLIPAFWGKGFGTEIATQLRKFGEAHQIAPRFISIIHKKNQPSMHVAKKNGMTVLFETEFLGMEVFVFGTPS